MPEAVEIMIQVNKLRPKCIGKTIIEINWNARYQRSGIKNGNMVTLPLKIIDIWSRGKVIVFETIDQSNNILYITSQLGMSGQWLFEAGDHSNLWMSFGEPSKTNPGYWERQDRIWYDDMRHFGSVGFYRNLDEVWKRHGPCLMLAALVAKGDINPNNLKKDQKLATLDLYVKEVRNKRFKNKRIAEFMMDQSRAAGVGNYIRNEVLYRAKISPVRLLTSLSDIEIENIYRSILDVMYESYMSKGKYYVGEECGEGFKFAVYKKQFDPNGYNVITFPDKNDRMCYYVPEVQK